MRIQLSIPLILSWIGFPLWAQGSQPEPFIRARVDVVNVVCTVKDHNDRYVSDLTREQFEIFEDGIRQSIDFFHNQTGEKAEPLAIVLLIDTSGSVKDKLEFEQIAAGEFLQTTLRKKKDMAAIVQFDSEINLVQNFTYDYSKLKNAILAIRAGGATKLYDAIWLAVEDLLGDEIGRRVLVILSDGADTQSTTSEQDAIKVAQEKDVVIYGIGVKSQRLDVADFGKLKNFAESTGGVFFNSKANLERLREAFTRINREIKNQYSLGYVSKNERRDGTFREIRVRVRKRKVTPQHRKGYFAPRYIWSSPPRSYQGSS